MVEFEAWSIVLWTALLVLSLVNIVGNSLVCWIIKKNQEMRYSSVVINKSALSFLLGTGLMILFSWPHSFHRTHLNYLIVNLAVADMMYAIFMAPVFLVKIAGVHPDGIGGIVLCKLVTGGNLSWFGAASSVFTLVAIAFERYNAVLYPFKNIGAFTKFKLKVIIASSWFFSTLLNIPLFLAVGLDERANKCAQLFPKEWMAKVTSWSWFLLPAFSTALMAFLYCRVMYNLWIKNKDEDQLTQQQMVVIRVRKRVTLMVVTVSAIFGICWCTGGTIYFVSYTAYASKDYNTVVLPISYLTVLFNSTANPFTYALLNQQFRSKMKMIFFPARFFLSTVQPSVGGESGNNETATRQSGALRHFLSTAF